MAARPSKFSPTTTAPCRVWATAEATTILEALSESAVSETSDPSTAQACLIGPHYPHTLGMLPEPPLPRVLSVGFSSCETLATSPELHPLMAIAMCSRCKSAGLCGRKCKHLRPVSCASNTAAHLLPLTPPRLAVASSATSNASTSLPCMSAKNRICACCTSAKAGRGSRGMPGVSAHC